MIQMSLLLRARIVFMSYKVRMIHMIKSTLGIIHVH